MNWLRLRYGLFWKDKHPAVIRPLFSVFVLMLLYTLASTLDYYIAKAQQLEHEQELKNAYQQIALNCATQAAQGGTAGFVLGNELFSMECQKLSSQALEGVKQ